MQDERALVAAYAAHGIDSPARTPALSRTRNTIFRQ